MPEDMPDRVPEHIAEDMPGRMPEDMPDRMPEDMPDKMPEDMPECLPDRTPEDLPDRMQDRMSEDMPEDMPDRMPDKMSDRMPEDLPVTKRINVMVGITRSKDFFFNHFFVDVGRGDILTNAMSSVDRESPPSAAQLSPFWNGSLRCQTMEATGNLAWINCDRSAVNLTGVYIYIDIYIYILYII